jgi:hypothetical protein
MSIRTQDHYDRILPDKNSIVRMQFEGLNL